MYTVCVALWKSGYFTLSVSQAFTEQARFHHVIHAERIHLQGHRLLRGDDNNNRVVF